MRKILLFTPLLLAITACATTQISPKPEMSLDEYRDRAQRNAIYGMCLRRGFMDSDTYGKAISIGEMAMSVSNQKVDSLKLINMTRETERKLEKEAEQAIRYQGPQMVDSNRKEFAHSFKYECQALSGMINTNYNELQELKRSANMKQPQTQTYTPIQNKISTTYCNTFGSQVICNSY